MGSLYLGLCLNYFFNITFTSDFMLKNDYLPSEFTEIVCTAHDCSKL